MSPPPSSPVPSSVLSSSASLPQLSEVDGLQRRRLVTFFNHFSGRTAAFLDAFAATCERRLAAAEGRMANMEAQLEVIEAGIRGRQEA